MKAGLKDHNNLLIRRVQGLNADYFRRRYRDHQRVHYHCHHLKFFRTADKKPTLQADNYTLNS